MTVGVPAEQNSHGFLLKGDARTFVIGNDYKQMLERYHINISPNAFCFRSTVSLLLLLLAN